MLRIFTYHDHDAPGAPGVLAAPGAPGVPGVLAGLTWALKRKAGLFGRPPLALTWADRTALVPEEAEYSGVASLLSLLMGHLGEEAQTGRVIVAFADGAQDLFFAAVLINGKPAIGSERLFDTSAELVTHIEGECASGQIDRLATTAKIAGALHSPLPVSHIAEQAFAPEAAPVCVEGKLARQLPGWQLAAIAGGTALLALTAAGLLFFPFQQSKPAAPIPITAVQITSRDGIAFARNCLAAFAGVWPLAPGWQLVSEGCATPEMRDPNLEGFIPGHAVAYRIWHLRRGFNAAIARKAAEAVMATRAVTATRTTPTGVPGAAARALTAARAVTASRAVNMVIRGNQLFSSTAIAAPMRNLGTGTDQGVPLTPAALLAATEAVFLGLADSIVLQGPGGSSTGGQTSGPGGGSGPRVRVTLKSGFAEVFERMQRIEGAEIARLNRSGGTITLEITTRRIVTVPAGTPGPREIAAKKPATQTRAADRELAGPLRAPDAASSEPETAANTQEDETI